VVLLRRFEDRTAEVLSCSGQAVQKVRLDFGWEGALVGEGIEGVEMEWNALCYDIIVSCNDATTSSFVTAAVRQYVLTHTVGLPLSMLQNCTSCHSWVTPILWQIVFQIWYSTSECLSVVQRPC